MPCYVFFVGNRTGLCHLSLSTCQLIICFSRTLRYFIRYENNENCNTIYIYSYIYILYFFISFIFFTWSLLLSICSHIRWVGRSSIWYVCKSRFCESYGRHMSVSTPICWIFGWSCWKVVLSALWTPERSASTILRVNTKNSLSTEGLRLSQTVQLPHLKSKM